MAFRLDQKALHAMLVALTLGGLTLFGIIHGPVVGFHPDDVCWGYVVVAGICALLRVAAAPVPSGRASD